MTALEAGKNPQSVYTPEALAACKKALGTILKKIGPWGTRLILIGGMVPRYLVGIVPKELKEHVSVFGVGLPFCGRIRRTAGSPDSD
jgi:hypothetical protein